MLLRAKSAIFTLLIWLFTKHLVGRATVELRVGRNQGSFIDKAAGGGKTTGEILIAVDGYSAPITAGNFVQSILSGAYDGAELAVGGETVSVISPKLSRKWLFLQHPVCPDAASPLGLSRR